MSIYQLSNLGNKPKEMVFSSQLKSYNNLVSRLNSSFIKTKTCQSVLKTLAGGCKIPFILPIFLGHKFVTDFKRNANFLDNLFTK